MKTQCVVISNVPLTIDDVVAAINDSTRTVRVIRQLGQDEIKKRDIDVHPGDFVYQCEHEVTE